MYTETATYANTWAYIDSYIHSYPPVHIYINVGGVRVKGTTGAENQQSLSTLTLNPKPVKETHPVFETWVRKETSLSLNPGLKTCALALKLVSKKHTLPLESESVEEMCPGPEIRV